MADDVARKKNQYHVVTSETATCHTRVHVRVCVSARVCVIKEEAPC